jgi:hypothetical protein
MKITDKSFEYEDRKYFRGNAHTIVMGSYGQKRGVIGTTGYLEVQAVVKSDNLADRVQQNPPVTIDWTQTTKADVEAESVCYFSLKGSASLTYEKAKNDKLKLTNFFINEGPLTNMLNKDADGARKYLADEGGDGRIVSEVWVVMDAELSEHFATSASVSVSAAAAGLNITVSGGKFGTQTITLSQGATFAYKLYKVTNWDNGRTTVAQMAPDYAW